MSGKLNIGKLSLLILVPVSLGAIYFFASKKNDHALCEGVKIKINYKTEKPLLSEGDIYRFLDLKNGKKDLIGKYTEALNMNEMEQKLLRQKGISKAEIFLGLSGEMSIEVTERTPIVRVFPEGYNGYYLSAERVRIPLSKNFTPDLIPVSGFMNDKMDRNLCAIVGYVNNNSFWKEQIQQFFVDANADISFIPFTGVHEVIIGDTTNLDEKFKKLEIFYKKGLSKIGWNKYKSVNLKYKGQVICK
jgi:cell division protein FtsQ